MVLELVVTGVKVLVFAVVMALLVGQESGGVKVVVRGPTSPDGFDEVGVAEPLSGSCGTSPQSNQNKRT